MAFAEPDPPRLLEVRGVTKSYGTKVALAGVDLDVSAGEVVGLLGPNGAGKTTLVSIVAGLRRPDGGSVRVNGIDVVADPRRARRVVGLAPQDTGVYPSLTCAQNLRLFARLAGIGRRAAAAAIDEVAAAIGLEELLTRRAGELSGGERRRLHTAIALVHRPRLVLLDEATVGADVQTRSQLLTIVRRLADEGSAVVYSTHYLGEIEQLDASVVIMDRGRVIARGDVASLVAAHAASIVELTFASPPPPFAALSHVTDVEIDGSVVRLRTTEPGLATGALLKDLGARAADLRSVQVIQPSLESVFVELTGRHYHAADVVAEAADVA